jgi:GntR family transcriptional repressor for pyruvate dehydrogenase complex
MPAVAVFTQSLTRSRLSEEIVTIVQKQILSGTIAAGTKLPTERDLAESFKVNRTTVREALRKLETLELIEIRHGDGLYARDIQQSGNLDLIKAAFTHGDRDKTIIDIMEGRRILVPEMASLAAQRRTDADLAELEQVIFSQDMAILERDIRVHQIIARSTHNLVYVVMLNFFNQFTRETSHLYFDDEDNVALSRRFHREIFEAIKRRSATEARRIMLDTLIAAGEALKDAMAHSR